MNKDNMRTVAKVIKRTQRFNLSNFAMIERNGRPHSYYVSGWKALWDNEAPETCNTVGCVAGWANAVAENKELNNERTAREFLGLTRGQADELFFAGEVWGMDDPYKNATADDAYRVLMELANGKRTFACDRLRK